LEIGIEHHSFTIFSLSVGIGGHDRREKPSSNYSKPKTRCMRQARMKINLRDEFYYIYKFEHEDNHILATCSQSHHLRSQRRITEAQLASIENAKAIGISNN